MAWLLMRRASSWLGGGRVFGSTLNLSDHASGVKGSTTTADFFPARLAAVAHLISHGSLSVCPAALLAAF